MLRRQTEIPMKGVLRVKVDAPMLEEGIELLLRRPILRIELVDVVVLYIEWLDVLLGTDNPCFPFRYGMVRGSQACPERCLHGTPRKNADAP